MTRIDKQVVGKWAMKYFNLMPSGGWSAFNRNAELADLIYEIGIDNVNESGWFYINPMSNMGIFEDENGNYLCLETRDEGDINVIIEMHVGLNDNISSGINILVKRLEAEYGLQSETRL